MNCLVPEVCDLTNYPYLPVDVESFRNASFWIKANDVQKIAYMNLLLISWHQIPASSLPNDPLLLEHFAGIGKRWVKNSNFVLNDWVLCSDNRYYHPYVAKKALEAWVQKLQAMISGLKGNEKRWGQSLDSSTHSINLQEAFACLQKLDPSSKSLNKTNVYGPQKNVMNPENLSGGNRKEIKPKKTELNRLQNGNINSFWNRKKTEIELNGEASC